MAASRRARWLAFAVPALLYLTAALVLGRWIVDDAGISFAYARNAAHLDGLVSQPGRPPVEGFSNFLWVLLLVPTFWLHLFDPVVVPKLFGAGATLAAFWILQQLLARRTGSAWPGAIACALVALAPPVVIWTVSGLENGLLLLLVVLFYRTLVEQPRRWLPWAGALAALVAMTRPDGLVYALVGGVVVVISALAGDATPAWTRRLPRAAAHYLLGFAGVFGPFFAYRLLRFGRPWPHTYYAKREFLSARERLRALWAHPGDTWHKLTDLEHGIAGPLGLALLVATFAGLVVLARRRALRRELWIAALLQVTALAAFVWIEPDWMHEYRFATAAVALSFTSAALAGWALWPRARRAQLAAWAVIALVVVPGFVARLFTFATNPTVPYDDVARTTRRFNAYAAAIGASPEHRASLMTPDLGAALMASDLLVYDGAGLCEPDVIRTLKPDGVVWQFDHPAFYDWVFEQARPTFIATSKFWTVVTALERDPRFARDYVAIDAAPDAWAQSDWHVTLHSGEWVRRDALPDDGALARLRAAAPSEPRPRPFAARLRDAVRGPEPPADATAAELLAAFWRLPSAVDPNGAVDVLQRALALPGPHRTETLRLLGLMLDYAGRYDEARRAWQDYLLALYPTHDDAAIADVQRRLGP